MFLQTLCTDFFHHALHRRIDGTDCDMFAQKWLQYAFSCFSHCIHHSITSDGNDSRNSIHWNDLFTGSAFSISKHCLNDIPSEMHILRSSRLNLHTRIGTPYNFVGGRFNFIHFKDIFALLISGEIHHITALLFECF